MTSNNLGREGKREGKKRKTLISQSEEQHIAWVSVPEHTHAHGTRPTNIHTHRNPIWYHGRKNNHIKKTSLHENRKKKVNTLNKGNVPAQNQIKRTKSKNKA